MGLRQEGQTNEPMTTRYTCENYRIEMRLLALKRRLQKGDLDENERHLLVEKIQEREIEMKIN
jgi:hypothetical protein